MLNENEPTDLLNEADMNQCWILVAIPHNPELRDFAWGFGGDLDFFLARQASESLEEDLSRWCQESHVPKAFDDTLSVDFGEMLKRHSETAFLDKYSRTCFAGELQEDEESGREFPDEVDGVPLSPAKKEGLMLDKIMIGGAPQAESRRRELRGQELPSDDCAGNLGT